MRFAFEAVHEGRVGGGEVRVEDLDGHALADAFINSFINRTHAALSEDAYDAVVFEGGRDAGRQWLCHMREYGRSLRPAPEYFGHKA
jgi:hypothetical protein